MVRAFVVMMAVVSARAAAGEPCGAQAHLARGIPYYCGSPALMPLDAPLRLLAGGDASDVATTEAPAPEQERVWPAFVIGTIGAALAGGYVAGAYLTGDRPTGVTLGVTGGVVTGGLLGAGLALGIGAFRKDPGSLVRYILVPVLSGLAGAALGGLGAGLGARVPGTGRTLTHVVVVSLLLAETITLIIAR